MSFLLEMIDSTSLVADDWSGLISRVAGDLDLRAVQRSHGEVWVKG